MIKNILILLFVIIVSTISSVLIKRYLEKSHVAKIYFVDLEHDFDTLRNQSDAEYYFVYKNLGSKNLQIYNIKSSCGCTIPSWNPGELKPNETDSFKVVYNIENKGYFIKEVLVYSNSESSPDKLQVLGYVPFE